VKLNLELDVIELLDLLIALEHRSDRISTRLAAEETDDEWTGGRGLLMERESINALHAKLQLVGERAGYKL
jgi:hypothetical protein